MAPAELDPGDGLLAADIFGTTDIAIIEARLVQWLAAQGFGLATVTAIEFSVGAGATLSLASGEKLFVKVWSKSHSGSALAAQMQVQQRLHRMGFPAPALLAGPCPLGDGHAVAMQYMRPGEAADARKPGVRSAMAQGLFQLMSLAESCRSLAGLPRLLPPPVEAVWPEPHNMLFDFGATRAGAEWIDAIAAEALPLLQRPVGDIVVGHNDWSAKNMRWDQGGIAAVYDWDAVFLGPETCFLGTAAAHFPVTWEIDVPLTPHPQEITAFIRDYETARARHFIALEVVEIEAAVTYAQAYKARCEHAVDPGACDWQGSSREALQLHGAFRFSAG